MIYATTANATMNPSTVGLTGSSDPVSVVQPSLAINYIICLLGLAPSNQENVPG